jgi:predicted RNase H-like nuclease (RuvC/YqgF family)
MNIEVILRQVSEIKEAIEEAKQDRSELKGAINEQMKGLAQYKIKSLPEAAKLINKKKLEIVKIEKNVSKLFTKLQEEYEW